MKFTLDGKDFTLKNKFFIHNSDYYGCIMIKISAH